MSKIDPTRARQGREGKRVLTILIVALVLALLAFIGMGIFGGTQPDENIDGAANSDASTAPATPPAENSSVVEPSTAPAAPSAPAN